MSNLKYRVLLIVALLANGAMMTPGWISVTPPITTGPCRMWTPGCMMTLSSIATPANMIASR